MTDRDPGLMNDLQDYLEGDGPTQDAAARRIDARKTSLRLYPGYSLASYPFGVTAVIPTIPPRAASGQLQRAMASVLAQTYPVQAVSVAVDHGHEGAAVTRNRALAGVRTEWTAFLDDDDEWLPGHVAALLGTAEATGADVVYPWFHVVNGFDPFPQYSGRPFDEAALRDVQNYIPVTVLARTRLLHDVGGFENRNDSTAPGASPCDEWGLWLKLLAYGARFVHYAGQTWAWHWENNTSGRGDRW